MGAISALTAKIAASKRRPVLLWSCLGLILGPVALLAVFWMPSQAACPSCKTSFAMRPGRRCPSCGWRVPVPLTPKRLNSIIKDLCGIRIGDTERKIARHIAKIGSECSRVEGCVRFSADISQHRADISVELTGGKAHQITVAFPVDNDFEIYYEQKRGLVAYLGRPDYENFDSGYTDNWSAGDILLSLNTTRDDHPKTSLICQKLDKNLADAINH